MLSKNKIKEINSLRNRKDRYEKMLFIAEGERLIEELSQAASSITEIFHTADCSLTLSTFGVKTIQISAGEMKRISKLSSPSSVLAVVAIPEVKELERNSFDNLILALDSIQDPGNLGTIIRLADWFGVDTIVCSMDTVDAYSPKVIQACMGSISRIRVIYKDLETFLKEIKPLKLPVYGTFMDGDNIYTEKLSNKGIIILGNEGNGISDKVSSIVSSRIHIPDFAFNRERVESLNVAMATAIVLSEFRRRPLQ